jgi:hypothetical protein
MQEVGKRFTRTAAHRDTEAVRGKPEGRAASSDHATTFTEESKPPRSKNHRRMKTGG